MSNKTPNLIHAVLDITALNGDDKARADLVSAILSLSPQSPLYKNNPAIQQAVTTLGTTFSAYKLAGSAAATSAKQAGLDAAAEAIARNTNNKALALLRSMVEHDATSPEDLQSMAFEPWGGKPLVPALLPPEVLDVTPGKKGYGTAKVSAHETGKVRRRYVAESSPDPVGPNTWSSLPGTGKSRTVTGKSGTSVWVRFAVVRGQLQSEWSTPVLVTLP